LRCYWWGLRWSVSRAANASKIRLATPKVQPSYNQAKALGVVHYGTHTVSIRLELHETTAADATHFG